MAVVVVMASTMAQLFFRALPYFLVIMVGQCRAACLAADRKRDASALTNTCLPLLHRLALWQAWLQWCCS